MIKAKPSLGKSLCGHRYGLLMLSACILVILTLATVLAAQKRDDSNALIDSIGRSNAKLLAEVSREKLHSAAAHSLLTSLRSELTGTSLAYIDIADSNGQSISSLVEPAVNIGPITNHLEPSQWNASSDLELLGGLLVKEFSAPILDKGQLAGIVRIAYVKATLLSCIKDSRLIASIALPVFLLAPLYLVIRRRQIRPLLRSQSKIIAQEASNDNLSPRDISILSDKHLKSNDSLDVFAGDLDVYVEKSRARVNTLQSDNASILASSKVLKYKFDRLTTMVESLPNGVLIFDHSGCIMFANNRAATMLTTNVQELMEQELGNWCTNRDIRQFMSKCANVANKAISPLRTTVIAGNRSLNLVLSSTPLFTGKDKAQSAGNLVLISDCSQEINAEASREEFVAHISHELKTPLNTLIVYSEALLGPDGADDQFRAEGLNIIFDETERMVGLINNLLSITKIEMGSMNIERQRVKLSEFLQDTFEKIEKGSLESGLNFDIKLPNDSLPVAIDKELMRIAINNLLTNAVKYSNSGDTVSLELEDLAERVRISVSDTGIGIADDDIEHIFDKFFRSESTDVRDRTGHGLGLSLAYDIVKLHNGYISVSSELNQGTTFAIEIAKERELLRGIAS